MQEMQETGRKHPINPIPFEVFYHGSWHAVDFVRIRKGKTYLVYSHQNSVEEEEICVDNIRLQSRKANGYDCSQLLKVGVDVCVLSTRPVSVDSNEEPQPNVPLWYDAKIISKKSIRHEGSRCSCLFSVILYRERALNCTGKNIMFERAEIVTIDRIAVLQKLSDELSEDGFNQWNYSEDCISLSNSKFVAGIISSEISWLVVISMLKGIFFHMKSLHRNIIYQILYHDNNMPCLNSMKGIKIMCFHRFNEILKPVVKLVDPFFVKEMAVETPLQLDVEPELSRSVEVDSESEVEVLYDCLSLRRSKRRKVKPKRFTSYSSPDFDRKARNSEQIVEILDQSHDELSDSLEVEEQLLDDCELHLVQRSSDEEYEMSPILGRKKTHDWKVEEVDEFEEVNPQLLLTMGEDIGEVNLGSSPGILTQLSYEKPEQGRRERKRDGGWKTPSSCPRKRLHKKSFWCRKKLVLTAVECAQLIKQCIGSIENDMKAEFEPGFHSEKIEEEENFKWSSSPEDRSEVDDNEDIWKEMEHTLAALALLEQQEMEYEPSDDETASLSREEVDQVCEHDFKLDEQIGIICQLCNFVQTEIRNVMPQFMMSENWNTNREYLGKVGFSIAGTYSLDPSSFGDAITHLDLDSLGGEDNVWALIPELKFRLYAHQRKAFEFLWRNIAGSLKPREMEIQSNETGGCVISHSPGSGKTFLLISFIISYLRLFPRSRPLILAPKIAVYVWRKEFEKWGVQFPLHVIHPVQSFRKEDLNWKVRHSSVEHRRPNQKMRHLVDCISKLQQWHKQSSVLLMSYSSFSLMRKESKDEHKKFMAKVLQNSPGLLIFDEGHNPRSTISKLRKQLMEVSTKSRILLSGTLFQNNFEEYFNTLCLARPSFFDDVFREFDLEKFNIYKKSEKRSKRKERMARKLFVQRVGEKIESNIEIDRMLGFNSLNKITNGFIDIYEDDNSGRLPGLVIYTLVLMPTEIQHEVLVRLQSCLKLTRRYPIELELLITVGSIHPWLIKTMAHAEDYFDKTELENIEKYRDSIISGSKVKFVFDIVQKSIIVGEKVLIFSHNIPPISLLVRFFETFLGWHKGEEVLVLQGDQEMSLRAKIMDKFNGDVENKCKVLIASTSACAEGISLTAASRVVLLDSEWNHSKTRQAIARAFRPGQERKVYVYKLLASGTWEEDKYRSNDWKAWLSKMISVGRYIEHNSCRKVDVVDDEILRELQEEDGGRMFQMIMEQN